MLEWLRKLFETDVYIPAEARVEQDESNGLEVKASFYTAPYGGDFRALSHTMTYIVEGTQFGIEGDLLIRAGNMIIGLPPEVMRIMHSSDEGSSVKYRVRPIPGSDEREVLESLGIK